MALVDGRRPRFVQTIALHTAVAARVLAAPAREDPREGVTTGPTKTGKRERRHGRQRSIASAAPGTIPPRTAASLEQGRMRSAEAEHGRCERPLPRPRGVPQSASLRTTRKRRGRTGNQRVRVLVVESLGSRHRSDVSNGACPAQRCKALRRERCLARRKSSPRLWINPDDGERQRDGEIDAQIFACHH